MIYKNQPLDKPNNLRWQIVDTTEIETMFSVQLLV